MTTRLCTLFDINYLPRALALHASLSENASDVRLTAFCMDAASHDLLRALRLPGLDLVSLADLEAHDPALAAVKPTRSQVEYCWTATPAICRYLFDRDPDLAEVTYIDADLLFFADPRPLIEEMGDASVLITPHRYAAEWTHWEDDGGIYNVQFVTFKRTVEGLAVLDWWRERCLEWCYARHEPGRFGDQKYLDDWPQRFEGVHVLEHLGGGVAPWNSSRYEFSVGDDRRTTVDGQTLIFYHCHALTLHRGLKSLGACLVAELLDLARVCDSAFHLTFAPIPLGWSTYPPYHVSGRRRPEHRIVWKPYARRLADAYRALRRLEPGFSAGAETVSPRIVAFWLLRDVLPDSVRRRGRRVRSVLRPDER